MTRDEILAMKAGPLLDIALGKALGCHVVKEQTSKQTFRYTLVVPFGVNSIDWTTEAGAWSGMPPLSETWEGMRLVVEAKRAMGYDFHLKINRYGRPSAEFGIPSEFPVWFAASGDTAPHAVALAALLAMEGWNQENVSS